MNQITEITMFNCYFVILLVQKLTLQPGVSVLQFFRPPLIEGKEVVEKEVIDGSKFFSGVLVFSRVAAAA